MHGVETFKTTVSPSTQHIHFK